MCSANPMSSRSWVTHIASDNLDGAVDEFDPVIFNAVFTGDLERHEAEIRKRWPGRSASSRVRARRNES